MDIVAHGLWTASAVVLARRFTPISPRAAQATVAAAVVPDLVHGLPLLAWAVIEGHAALPLLHAYAVAQPGREPWLPTEVAWASHHLHCAAHSAVIALVATLWCLWTLRRMPILLLGWWLHIVIDVFTHSADFYAAPVLYPLSDWAFDGVAWNAPAFLALNYLALAAAGWVLWRRRSNTG
ncbi:MAG TPA: hypothetical protein VFO28_03735 [Burkholderiaceae bacterium]|nr:hypothetical protein [Burkholderiaceae bacterium]